MTLVELEDLWRLLDVKHGLGHTPFGAPETVLARTAADPVAEWLEANYDTLGYDATRTKLFLRCPWEADHSADSGPSQAAWLLGGSSVEYSLGNFHCFHASCAEHKTAEFLRVVGCTLDPRYRKVLDASDCLAIASAFLDDRGPKPNVPWLLRTAGDWYVHAGPKWVEAPHERIRADVWMFLHEASRQTKNGPEPFKPRPAEVNATLDALAAVALLEGQLDGRWLPGYAGPPADELLSVENGLLHLPTRALHPHSAGFLNRYALPFPWVQDASPPQAWLGFLEQLLPGDQEAQDALQEFFGYCLTADTTQQKMLLIRGPKRSGKGTIGRVLGDLVGSENLVSPPLSSLATNFGLEPLIGKLVALVPDARLPAGPNGQSVVEKLLMISGMDSVTVDRKNRQAWTGTLATRIVVLTNEIPQLVDASGAIASRFITIALTRSFYGSEDLTLGSRLRGELPGILRWALDGRDRLLKRGHFVQPASGAADARDLIDSGSPILTFVSECCQLAGELEVAAHELYDAYRQWCHRSGRSYPGTLQTFGRYLRSAVPGLEDHRPAAGGAGRPRYYVGIGLTEEGRRCCGPVGAP